MALRDHRDKKQMSARAPQIYARLLARKTFKHLKIQILNALKFKAIQGLIQQQRNKEIVINHFKAWHFALLN